MIQPIESLFLLLLIVTALAALNAPDLLAAVIVFGAFSFFAALFYAIVGALDVAFTEAALGAVIATVFFICAIHRAGRRAS